MGRRWLTLAVVLVATAAEAQVAIGRLQGTIAYTQTIPVTGWVAYPEPAASPTASW